MKGISKIISASIIIMRLGSSRADPCASNQFVQMPVAVPSQVLTPGRPADGIYNCGMGSTPQVFYPTANGLPTAPGALQPGTTTPTTCEVSVVKNCEGNEEKPKEPETVIVTPPPETKIPEIITVQTITTQVPQMQTPVVVQPPVNQQPNAPVVASPVPIQQIPTNGVPGVVGVPIVGPNGQPGVVGVPAIVPDCNSLTAPGMPVNTLPGVSACGNMSTITGMPSFPGMPVNTLPGVSGYGSMPSVPGMPVSTLPGVSACGNMSTITGMPMVPEGSIPAVNMQGFSGVPTVNISGAAGCFNMSTTTLPNPAIGSSYDSDLHMLGGPCDLGEVGKSGDVASLGNAGCTVEVNPSQYTPASPPPVEIGPCAPETARVTYGGLRLPASTSFVNQIKNCSTSENACGDVSQCGEASSCQSSCQQTSCSS
ncbi:hypothetical protein HK407_06g11350 [Ordospora pajunii]|uniref:uncharacterized protein n=1 Tax=Ordospora pajunii TaxID=3039483 RepID=UPI0029525F0C|nr:uncharacterized protein HK407_06g11350 [Ordospora pajunii]KAH9411304.1 hypothetical protein HK407_06g11350 [Ordospora pajunii]